MKFDYVGAGGIFVGVGVTVVLAVPPPWWPKMPSSLIQLTIVCGFALAAVGLAIMLLGAWPAMPDPKGPIALTAIGLSLFVLGGGWWAFAPGFGARTFAQKTRPQTAAALQHLDVQGMIFDVDYSSGLKVAGIRWEAGFSRSRIVITNTSAETYLEVDIIISPEKPIVRARVKADFASCRIGPLGRPPGPIIIDSGKGNTSSVEDGADDDDENILIGPSYRLVCDKMLPKTQIIVDIATVDPIWNSVGKMWQNKRADIAFVHFATSFSAEGRHFDKSYLLVAEKVIADSPIIRLVEAPPSPTPLQPPTKK